MLVSFVVIGRNIREARKHKCITQEKAAEELDMSLLHYGRLERGQRQVSLNQLAKIAKLFNVSFDDLLSGSSEYLRSDFFKNSSLGTIIDSVAAGCSKETCNLIIEVCQTIAKHDKYHSP